LHRFELKVKERWGNDKNYRRKMEYFW